MISKYMLPRLHGDARSCKDDFWGQRKVMYDSNMVEKIIKKEVRSDGREYDDSEVENAQIF